MAKEGMNFDIPEEMRSFAEKSVEQARAAFDSFVSATQQAVNTAHNQAVNVHNGTRDVGELAMRYAERNITSSFQFAQQLLQAKDAQEVTKLHTEYVKKQMAALAEQAQELGKKASTVATGSAAKG